MTTETSAVLDLALVSQGQDLERRAAALAMQTADDYAEAGAILAAANAYIRAISAHHDPRCEERHQRWKAATTERARLLDPAEAVKRRVGGAMAAWDREQERLRREADDKARREREAAEAEARRKADEETARLRAAAEAQRARDAEALAAQGDTEAGVRLLEHPVEIAPVVPVPMFVPAPPVAPPVKVAGLSTVDHWTYEVVDESRVPREYMRVDDVKLGRVVKAMKGATQIPGIRAVNRPITRDARR